MSTANRIWATPSDAYLEGGTYCNADCRPTAPNGDARLYVRDDVCPAPSLADALALPEVAALVEAVKPYISPVQNADYGRQIQQYEALLEAFSKIKAVG